MVNVETKELMDAVYARIKHLEVELEAYKQKESAPIPAIPPGYVLVPEEPSKDMAQAGRAVPEDPWNKVPWRVRMYQAMIANAPPAGLLNLRCKSEQKRLASLWGYVKDETPTIHANFETTKGVGWTGTMPAPVKRVENNDDGSYTVIIDHWPQP